MALTALNDWLPPDTCMTARVRPWVGRTPPSLSGSQSIWTFITPDRVPWRSGLLQTCPSDHIESARNSCTLGWAGSAASGSGSPAGSNRRVSQPIASSSRSASSASSRE